MITPNLLYITKKDFDRLVLEAEENFMEERSNHKPEERESSVQFGCIFLTPLYLSIIYANLNHHIGMLVGKQLK